MVGEADIYGAGISDPVYPESIEKDIIDSGGISRDVRSLR